jgi:hypothetical protein
MADVAARVPDNFLAELPQAPKLGDWYAFFRSYPNRGKRLSALAEKGSRLFVVLERPGRKLWLFAVLSELKRRGNEWVARTNPTRVVDITKVALAGRFDQPRVLDAAEVARLEQALSTGRPHAEIQKKQEKLIFRRCLRPKTLKDLSPLQRSQAQALDWLNLAEQVKNLELFEIVDEKGKLRFHAVIHVGDDGHVFPAGESRVIASFSQGGISEVDDDALEEPLEDGFDAYLATRKKGRR